MSRYRPGVLGSLLAAVVLTAGCGSSTNPEFDPTMRSRVVDLEFVEEHTITIEGPCLISTEDGICLLDGDTEQTVEDAWYLTVKQCDAPDGTQYVDHPDAKDCEEETYEIGEPRFNALDEGDVVTTDRDIVLVPQKRAITVPVPA